MSGDTTRYVLDLAATLPVVVTTTNPVGISGVLLNTTKMPAYLYITEYNGIPVE